jgi:hypothetical protein
MLFSRDLVREIEVHGRKLLSPRLRQIAISMGIGYPFGTMFSPVTSVIMKSGPSCPSKNQEQSSPLRTKACSLYNIVMHENTLKSNSAEDPCLFGVFVQ